MAGLPVVWGTLLSLMELVGLLRCTALASGLLAEEPVPAPTVVLFALGEADPSFSEEL